METKMMEFSGNGDMVPGYLAKPDGDGPFPAVVVIQEWWGLNAHIKDVTERFAREGFAALAPDLYRGAVALEPDDARKLAMELDRPQAIKDIQGAADYLLDQPYVAPKKAGVMGFCMGGGLTAMMAYLGQNVGAAVMFFGNVRDLANDDIAAQVSAPLMGNFGEADAGIPVDTVQAAEQALKKHGKVCDFYIYPNAPHAFFNDDRPHIYQPDAAAHAWGRTLGWLRQYLV
jgi:carboxymethylenebutenolidase